MSKTERGKESGERLTDDNTDMLGYSQVVRHTCSEQLPPTAFPSLACLCVFDKTAQKKGLLVREFIVKKWKVHVK